MEALQEWIITRSGRIAELDWPQVWKYYKRESIALSPKVSSGYHDGVVRRTMHPAIVVPAITGATVGKGKEDASQVDQLRTQLCGHAEVFNVGP